MTSDATVQSEAVTERPRPGEPGRVVPKLAPPIAIAVAWFALGHGIFGDALFHDGGLGIAVPIWIATIVLGTIAATWRARGRVQPETFGWLAAAVVLSAGCAWREAEELRLFDVLATIGSLALAGLTIHDPRLSVFTSRLSALAQGMLRSALGVAAGIVPLATRDFAGVKPRQRWAQQLRGTTRVVIIVIPLALIFGSLLSGADPIFASIVSLPAIDLGTVVSHVALTGVFTWILAGWLRSAIVAMDDAPRTAYRLPFQLDVLETTAALLTLNVLFAVYVAAQIGWLFGGEAFLRARTGLTAAEYARRGFFETVAVVALVVPVLFTTRAMLRQSSSAVRRHTSLALPIVVLVSVIILSAIQRMRLYVSYYGMSTDRLYALVFMAWLGVVLVWMAATVLRSHDRLFIGGAIASGLLALGTLNVVSPDIAVARTNIQRSARATTAQQQLDVAYLATLSGDAVDLTTRALLDGTSTNVDAVQRCQAAQTLIKRWGPQSRSSTRMAKTASWRWRNSGERAAVRAVDTNLAALQAIANQGCPRPSTEPVQR